MQGNGRQMTPIGTPMPTGALAGIEEPTANDHVNNNNAHTNNNNYGGGGSVRASTSKYEWQLKVKIMKLDLAFTA